MVCCKLLWRRVPQKIVRFATNWPCCSQQILTFQRRLLILATSCNVHLFFFISLCRFTNKLLLVVTALRLRQRFCFCRSMWRNGNFTPRPESQTFSTVLLIFVHINMRQWVTHCQQLKYAAEEKTAICVLHICIYESASVPSRYCWDTESVMSRDGADREPAIPVKSTSTCIWSRTGLTLNPPDKRQQTNDKTGGGGGSFQAPLETTGQDMSRRKNITKTQLLCLCLCYAAHNYNLYVKRHKWKYRKLLWR